MDPKTDGLQGQATYQVIAYAGLDFPKAYRNMLYSKWMRSLKYGNDYFRLADSKTYYQIYHNFIDSILGRPNCLVRFAVLADDPDVVLGFSITRGNVLDYVHVHADQRRQGIATSLVPKDITVLSHLTKDGISFWTSKLPDAIFNPFA